MELCVKHLIRKNCKTSENYKKPYFLKLKHSYLTTHVSFSSTHPTKVTFPFPQRFSVHTRTKSTVWPLFLIAFGFFFRFSH